MDNAEDVDRLIEKIGTIKDVDMALLAGDVLDKHERVNTQLMMKASDLFEALCNITEKTFVLVGNHDYIDNSQFCTAKHWMYSIKQFSSSDRLVVVDRPMRAGITSSNGSGIVVAPYIPPGRFVEALDTHVNGWKCGECSLIFAHQEFRGCKIGAIVSTNGDEWDTSFPLVISGHIHDRHRPQANVYYPGAVLDHGMYIIDTHDMSECHVPVNVKRKPRTEYTSVEEILRLAPSFDPYVKYSVEGTVPEITAFKKTTLYDLLRSNCKFRENKDMGHKSGRARTGFRDILARKVTECNDAYLSKDYMDVVDRAQT